MIKTNPKKYTDTGTVKAAALLSIEKKCTKVLWYVLCLFVFEMKEKKAQKKCNEMWTLTQTQTQTNAFIYTHIEPKMCVSQMN